MAHDPGHKRVWRRYPSTTLWLLGIVLLELVLILQNFTEHH